MPFFAEFYHHVITYPAFYVPVIDTVCGRYNFPRSNSCLEDKFSRRFINIVLNGSNFAMCFPLFIFPTLIKSFPTCDFVCATIAVRDVLNDKLHMWHLYFCCCNPLLLVFRPQCFITLKDLLFCFKTFSVCSFTMPRSSFTMPRSITARYTVDVRQITGRSGAVPLLHFSLSPPTSSGHPI